MIKGILFDLDGTLLNTMDGVLNSVKYTINQLNLPLPDNETLQQFIGPPIQISLMKHFSLNQEEVQVGANIFREYYKNHALLQAVIYDHIYSLLDYLKAKKYKMGVATYKREDYATTLLEHFKIAEYCNVIHGADNENKLTKCDIVNKCCNELHYKKSEIVLIGDTIHDAVGAEKAGIHFIAVTWGFGYKPYIKQIEYPNIAIVNTPKEIMKYI